MKISSHPNKKIKKICHRPSFSRRRTSDNLTQSKIKLKKKTNTLENQFLISYKNKRSRIKLPDLTNTLIKTKISKNIRAKMIDWKIEVLKVFHNNDINLSILLKSIQIMDLYIKFEKSTILQNNDIHLIGITSMYISSKLENQISNSISNYSKISGNAYSNEKIREMEFKILKILNFKISYPIFIDLLDYYLLKLFIKENSDNFEHLKTISEIFLVFISFNDKFNDVDADILVNACLLNALRYYYSSCFVEKSEEINFGDIQERLKNEKNIIKCIFNQFDLQKNDLRYMAKKIQKYLKDFQKEFDFLKEYKHLINFNKDFIN